jgi:Family of unknown function (DUF5360)
MTSGLRWALLITDILMLTYWLVTALAALGVLQLPPAYLYRDYNNPLMVSWNWSFAPLDLIFSLVGLTSVRLARCGDARWRGLAILSLSLTFCAGLMAITFWTLQRDFDLSWWVPNLALMVWPLFFLPGLIGDRR